MNKRGFIESGFCGENNPPAGQGEKPRHQTRPEKENDMGINGNSQAPFRGFSAAGTSYGDVPNETRENRIENTTKSVQDLITRVEELRGIVGPLADRLLGEEIANAGESGQIYAIGGQINTLDDAISELGDGLRLLSKQIDRLNVL